MTSSEKKQGKKSPYSTKMGHMKGHVSVKSNAFSPTCKRLSSQDMVLDNMIAHTRKINSVKPRIDNSVPKTWTTSIIKKDQLRRQAMQTGNKPSRPSSAQRNSRLGYSASAPVSPAKLDQYLDGDLSLEDFEILSDINGDDIHFRTPRSSPAYPRNRSANDTFTHGHKNRNTSQMVLSARGNQSHDLLDTMATRFTEGGKSHTPRFLKTPAKSKLAQSKYYNPPKRKNRKSVNQMSTEEDEVTKPRVEKEKERKRTSSRLTRDFMKQEESESVDKRNEDHIRWVEEQAERVNHLHLDEVAEMKEDHDRDTHKDLPIYSARFRNYVIQEQIAERETYERRRRGTEVSGVCDRRDQRCFKQRHIHQHSLETGL